MYTWGQGTHGQLGHSTGAQWVETPKLVPALAGLSVESLACGEAHTAALMGDGSVYTWGSSMHGQLGHGGHEQVDNPMAVDSLRTQGIQAPAHNISTRCLRFHWR